MRYLLFILLSGNVFADTVTHTDYTEQSVISSSLQNTNENAIYTAINGNISGSTANSGGSAVNIKQGTISTPDIRRSAVLNYGYSVSSTLSASESNTLKNVTLTSIGYPVLLIGNVSYTFPAGFDHSTALKIDITEGTNGIGGASCTVLYSNSLTNETSESCVIYSIYTPIAGFYTYNLSSNYNTTYLITSSLTVIELRN